MKIFAERLWTGGGFLKERTVHVKNGRIASIDPGLHTDADLHAEILTPGLIDKHQHGAMGFNASAPDEKKCREWLKMLARHGVTNVLYTISTGTIEEMARGVAFCAAVMQAQASGDFPGARIEGVHLEGPFINPKRSGAMAKAKIQAPSMQAFLAIAGRHSGIIRAITMAPELDGAAQLSSELIKMGVCVQAGHTDATCTQAEKAFREDGFSGVTHFYNAARPIAQRDPGILATAMLEKGVDCEAICDFVHVAPEALQILFKVKGFDGVSMISDCVSTAGLPDGVYESDSSTVIVRGRRNFSPDGGIAGGSDQMDLGVRNVLGMGVAPEDAFKMASANPAKYLGLDGLGDIRPGMRACMAAWTADYQPEWSLADGQMHIV